MQGRDFTKQPRQPQAPEQIVSAQQQPTSRHERQGSEADPASIQRVDGLKSISADCQLLKVLHHQVVHRRRCAQGHQIQDLELD